MPEEKTEEIKLKRMNPQRLEAIATSIRFADPTAKVSVAIVVETEKPLTEGSLLCEFLDATAEKEKLQPVLYGLHLAILKTSPDVTKHATLKVKEAVMGKHYKVYAANKVQGGYLEDLGDWVLRAVSTFENFVAKGVMFYTDSWDKPVFLLDDTLLIEVPAPEGGEI